MPDPSRRAAPARASKLLSVAIGVGALGGLTWYTGLFRLGGVAVTGGVILGLAGLAGGRDTTPSIALSSLLFVACVLVLTVAAVLAALVPAEPFNVTLHPSHAWPLAYLLGVTTAATGLTLAVRQDVAGAAARSLVVTTGASCAITGSVLVVSAVAGSLLSGPGAVITEWTARIISPATGAAAFPTLVFLVGLSIATVGILLARLPIPALVERERRKAVRDRLSRLARRFRYAGGAAALVGGTVGFLVPSVWAGLVGSMPAAASGAIGVAAAFAPIRIALLVITVVGSSLAGAIGVLRRVRPDSAQWLLGLTAHSTGGGLLIAVVFVHGPSNGLELLYDIYARYGAETEQEVLTSLVTEFGAPAVTFGIIVAACFGVALLVHLAGALGYLRIVPPKTGGFVLAAGGIVGAAIVAGELSGRSWVLFAVVGAALVLWDVGTYGQRLRLELSRGSRRLELLHAGTMLIVAGCSVGLVYGALAVTETLDPRGTAAAAIAALVGVLLVTSAARG